VLLYRKVLAAIFKAILSGLLVGSQPFPITLLPLAPPAQLRVTIKVDISRPLGRFEPVWAWVGHDEANYTYSEEGRNLLTQLSQLSPYPVHDRTHNLLTSGDGTPALKWGSTNAFSRDWSRRPVWGRVALSPK
jgi:xylan 1,4-beta-xylosidase